MKLSGHYRSSNQYLNGSWLEDCKIWKSNDKKQVWCYTITWYGNKFREIIQKRYEVTGKNLELEDTGLVISTFKYEWIRTLWAYKWVELQFTRVSTVPVGVSGSLLHFNGTIKRTKMACIKSDSLKADRRCIFRKAWTNSSFLQLNVRLYIYDISKSMI